MRKASASADADRPLPAPQRTAGNGRANAGLSGSAERPIVYLVDDDESIRRSISLLLRTVGLDVETFSSAADFLAFQRPDRTCCLVCDVRLPAQSGLELQERLIQRHDDLAIIFVTGFGTVQLVVRAMRAGAIHFLEKPFEDQDLLDAIFQALEREEGRRKEARERVALRQRFESLTPREREVLELVVAGFANKRIAARLGASEKTIKVHRGRVMEKMQAESLAQLVGMTVKILPPTQQ
jgi:RNA polymerase sigma factor (sigma-70 family)